VKQTEILVPEQDEDYLRCLDYIVHREVNNLTVAAFADKYHVDVRTVLRWQTEWKERGLLASIRRMLATGMTESIIVTNRRTAARWETYMATLDEIIFNGRQDTVRADAIKWIYEHVVAPQLSENEDRSHEEADYLRSVEGRVINPMSISDRSKSDPETT